MRNTIATRHTAFRLDSTGQRACDVSGCWQRWPCATHGAYRVGPTIVTDELSYTRIVNGVSVREQDYLRARDSSHCTVCGYHICGATCPTLKPKAETPKPDPSARVREGWRLDMHSGVRTAQSNYRRGSYQVTHWGDGNVHVYDEGGNRVGGQPDFYGAVASAMDGGERREPVAHIPVEPQGPKLRDGWERNKALEGKRVPEVYERTVCGIELLAWRVVDETGYRAARRGTQCHAPVAETLDGAMRAIERNVERFAWCP